LLIVTTSLKLQSSFRDDGLPVVYPIALARQASARRRTWLLSGVGRFAAGWYEKADA
jgi:hypothetical protein